MIKIVVTLGIVLIFVCALSAQVPTATLIKIVKAEDARAFDTALEALIKSPNADIRTRAALAAGRIGDDKALPALAALLENDVADAVRAMAAFAIGEIESSKGADAILKALNDPKTPNAVRARAVEAAGKIAAANAKDEQAKALGLAILDTLKTQSAMASTRDSLVTQLALTAILRAKPEGGDALVAKFLTDQDPRIRAVALP